MITFPCAKINLGLNVVSKREDGYHNIETVFYPIPLFDALEINTMNEMFPSASSCDLKITGNTIECNETDNLVIKAYNILAAEYNIPRIHIHLQKNIPSQAGLGGGSSDAAYMLRVLNDCFNLQIDNNLLRRYAAKIGADCAFFITSTPAFATGIGENLNEIDINSKLKDSYIAIIKPNVSVSTKIAYSMITPMQPKKSCMEIIKQPIETWKDELANDFENPVFACHPELLDIKNQLYDMGAIYAQMSGSGSAFFGIFKSKPENIDKTFPQYYKTILKL